MRFTRTIFALLLITSSCFITTSYALNNSVTKEIHSDHLNNGCELLSYERRKNLKIRLVFTDPTKWSNNVVSALNGLSPNISEKHKSWFPAKLYANDGLGECEFESKVRLTGDWKDHINTYSYGKIRTSLAVKTLGDTIYGIPEFKLLEMKTRNGYSEVVTVNILNQLGVLSPLSFIVNFDNGAEEYNVIFQEQLNKEFLERNKIRETAIIETNESALWEYRSVGNAEDPKNDTRWLTSKISNPDWAMKSKANAVIANNAIRIYLDAVADQWGKNIYDQFLDERLLVTNNKLNQLLRYRAIILAVGAGHNLFLTNRRFYYDPMYEMFVPIYYDGNPTLRQMGFEKMQVYGLKNLEFNNLISDVNQIDRLKLVNKIINDGVPISMDDVDKALSLILLNIEGLKYASTDWHASKNRTIDLNQSNFRYEVINKNESMQLCEISANKCESIHPTDRQLRQLYSGKFRYNNRPVLYQPFVEHDAVAKSYGVVEDLHVDINYLAVGDVDVFYDKSKRIFNYKLKSTDSKLLLYNSKFDQLLINGVGFRDDNKPNISDGRSDTNLLTGCLTIADSKFKNLKFHVIDSSCEDGINFLRSDGNILHAIVKNSTGDALDADFSNIEFANLKIINAHNDCVDLSSGKYDISNSNLISCKDKGVSVGEQSNVNLYKINVNGANIAIAVKDGSNANINEIKAMNVDKCIESYRKKPEFGAPHFNTKNLICNSIAYPIY